MNGFVGTDVHIAGVGTQLPATGLGNGGKSASLAVTSDMRLAIFFGLGQRLFAPTACHYKVRSAAAVSDLFQRTDVQRNDGVFSQSAALHKQNAKVGRHRQQLAQIRLGLGVN